VTRRAVWVLTAVLMMLVVYSGRARAASVANAAPPVMSRFVALTGASWSDLAAGKAGQGLIEYYLPARGAQRPSLVVWLRNDGRASLARVYEAPTGRDTVPLDWRRPLRTQLTRMKPILVLAAPHGWWSRNQRPDYDVTVDVFGPVYTMWGGKPGPHSYLAHIRRGPLAFVVYLHGDHGQPVWDDRRLIPPFPGHGYIRASYAQSECTTVRRWVPGPTPLWPYVAYAGPFLQGVGTESPPIVVNWSAGRVVKFSEVVSLRNQSCSYGFYSDNPVVPGQVNHPNFESPWGFYTLSPQRTGLPNLVIRVNWKPTSTLRDLGLKTMTPLASNLMRQSQETVRYSWADHPGNQLFNYKVDMAGPRSIHATTRIMGGQTVIVAPKYHGYAAELIHTKWPVTTFVDQNAKPYLTSEGLYQWSAGLVGRAFLYGEANAPDLSRFHSITVGSLGEYRVGGAAEPWLYASPIDGRLHLLGANAGVWRVTPQWTLYEGNLTDGDYIDRWTLAKTGSGGKAQDVARVDALDDHVLMYAGPSGLEIRSAPFVPAAFTILPPTNAVTWRQFVARVARYQTGKNPLHLSTWLTGWLGPQMSAPRGSISDVVPTTSGFQSVVTVGGAGAASTLPGAGGRWRPGRYVLTYQRSSMRFVLRPDVRRTLLQLQMVPATVHTDEPAPITVRVEDTGPAPWRGMVRMKLGHRAYRWDVAIAAGQGWTSAIVLTANHQGWLRASLAADGEKTHQHIRVLVTSRPATSVMAALSFPSWPAAAVFLLAVGLLAMLNYSLWQAHVSRRLPVSRGRHVGH